MPKITTPVKGFTGKVAGVAFTDGVGTTKDEAAVSYFTRQGYTVAPTEAELKAAAKAAADAKAEAEAAEKAKAAAEAEKAEADKAAAEAAKK